MSSLERVLGTLMIFSYISGFQLRIILYVKQFPTNKSVIKSVRATIFF